MATKRKTRPPEIRWTVRDVPPESREAAKVAARKSGQKLGEWLDRAIRVQAKEAAGLPATRQEDLMAQILQHWSKPWYIRAFTSPKASA